ncbi:hypothetical protein [Goodfellowiella coeruleoviolacea]|uniref:hypothetical protein n=1 Tax=Goodfellowiella coeruleoviolacea TaxID=334858 RepID=UPI0020A52626|nr:hypothetical protein [Goodfellowiella coeruleoviolacea]
MLNKKVTVRAALVLAGIAFVAGVVFASGSAGKAAVPAIPTTPTPSLAPLTGWLPSH